jgi:CRP-like cAMP-binding protein
VLAKDMTRAALNALRLAGDLQISDIDELEKHIKDIVTYQEGETIVEPELQQSTCHLLLEGVGFRLIGVLGRRQITNFLFPGDLVDVHPLFYGKCSFWIIAGTLTRFALIGHDALSELMARRRNVSDAFWRLTLRDAAIEREWILNVAQRSSGERLAHLLSEITARLTSTEASAESNYAIPISIRLLSDAIHCPVATTTDVLTKFAERGLLRLEAGKIVVLKPQALAGLAGFDPTYLDLDGERRLV